MKISPDIHAFRHQPREHMAVILDNNLLSNVFSVLYSSTRRDCC